MTGQLTAIFAITVLPLITAALAFRLLPDAKLNVDGRLGPLSGLKINATGALALYVLVAAISWVVWKENKPALHERYNIYTFKGKARLPDGVTFNRSDFRAIVSPPIQDGAEFQGVVDWYFKAPVRMNADGEPDYFYDPWKLETFKIIYGSKHHSRSLGVSDLRVSEDDERTLIFEEIIDIKPKTVQRGSQGIQNLLMEPES